MGKLIQKSPISNEIKNLTAFHLVEHGETPTSTTININTNGAYYPSDYGVQYFDKVDVSVQGGGGTGLLQKRIDAQNISYLYAGLTDGEIPDDIKVEDLSFMTTSTAFRFGLRGIFCNCSGLTNVTLRNLNNTRTTNLTNYEYMFYGCLSLENFTFENFNNSATTINIANMFTNCRVLSQEAISNFVATLSTKVLQSLSATFSNCSQLIDIDLSGANRLGNERGSLFNGCGGLISVAFPESNSTTACNYASCFNGCSSLQTITGTLNLKNAISTTNMFRGCESLTTLPTMTNINVNLDLSPCLSLSAEEIVNKVLNNLLPVYEDIKTLTLGATLLNLLSDEEKAMATDKGWILA